MKFMKFYDNYVSTAKTQANQVACKPADLIRPFADPRQGPPPVRSSTWQQRGVTTNAWQNVMDLNLGTLHSRCKQQVNLQEEAQEDTWETL
jgi:hypothetical protein